MTLRVQPAWAIHLQPGSKIPLQEEAARRYLRRGYLAEALLSGGHRPALVAGDIALSYDELRAAASAAAGRLKEIGVTQGLHVALLAENSAAWIISYLGLQVLGATVVGMNPAFKEAEAEQILTDSEAAVALVDAGRQSLIDALRPRLKALHHIARVKEIGSLETPHPDPPPQGGRDIATLQAEDPALLLYTSGTTGRPKGALLDHGNFLAQGRGAIEVWRWTSRDVLVHALPLFHLHGLGMGLHGTLLSGGSATLVPFTPAGVVAELKRGGTMFFGVPSMYQRLCDWLDENPTDLSHVRVFVCGSAPLPPALYERCARLLGQPPVERYGITEGGIVVTNPYDGPRRPGRVGLPFPGIEVKLGELDEVLLKRGQVFSGYWRNPQATREAFTDDGFFRTGDVGEIGEDGTLAIRGRIKELIITGGFNVYPREAELVLEAHPAVQEVAVAGVPSEKWGEEVTAFVVASGTEPLDERDLIAFAHERLAAYKCPKRVVAVEKLPRNAMGKVQRGLLVK